MNEIEGFKYEGELYVFTYTNGDYEFANKSSSLAVEIKDGDILIPFNNAACFHHYVKLN